MIPFQYSIKLDSGEIYVCQAETAEDLGLMIEEIRNKFLKRIVDDSEDIDEVSENDMSYCQVHKVQMKEREGKTGNKYFDHRKNFGTYNAPIWDICYGKGWKGH